MRITILALGSRGDIVPYSILGKALHAAGHDVWFITSKNFEHHITSQGLSAYSLPGDADAILGSAGSKMTALMRAFRDVSKGIVQLNDELLPIFEKTDLILNQLPGGVYGFDLAEKFNIPMFMVAVIPLIRTKAFQMIGSPRIFRAIPGYNYFSYRIAELIAWQMLRSTINPWRIDQLDLPVDNKCNPIAKFVCNEHVVGSEEDGDALIILLADDVFDIRGDGRPPVSPLQSQKVPGLRR